jgi:hypothetical protein
VKIGNTTIVSTIASAMTVEVKPQLNTEVLSKAKEIVPSVIHKEKDKEVEASIEEINLDEDIIIPNRDTSNLTLDEMDTLGELWKKRARRQKLRVERKQRNQVLEDIKGIFYDALNIEVDEKQPILDKLVDIVHKYNEELNGQEKLLQRVERKFENKVLEKVA